MAELLHRMLERNARKYPEAQAVRYARGDVSWTWPDLDSRASAVANRLQGQGVGKGDRVALLIPNRPAFLSAYFGVLKAGAVAVPVNVKLTPAEVAYILTDSGAAALLHDPSLAPVATQAAGEAGTRMVVDAAQLDNPAGQPAAARTPAAPAASTAGGTPDPVYQDPGAAPDDLAEIIYTSGTTGRPKGVMLSHAAVHSVASMMAYEMDIRRSDRVLVLMPLTHSAPLNLMMVGAVYAGAATVVGDFSPQALLELTQSERTTHFFGAPVAYLLAARSLPVDQYDLSSARYWIYGGAPMSREAVTLAQSRFPGKFVSVYGLTESGPTGVALYAEEHPHLAGSIGRAGVVNAELRVVDARGQDVPADEPGEIIMRAPSVMTGYWGNEAATREVLRDGWLWTGDIARRDAQGYLWILDRKKDVIISGGVNVYPKEVEDVLASHPAVADLAVVGRPHPDWGETVTAVIVLRPGQEITADELQAFARQKLADFKVPRRIEFVAAIPRNASGKILKHLLRQSQGA